MSTQVHQQLREASVVLSPAEVASYQAGVEKLAIANVSVQDQLTRLRLSFGMDPGSEASTRFDQQLAAAELTVRPRDLQLRRTLAASILVARFARPPGRRGPANLAPDTGAALGAQVLLHRLWRPVHPDVGAWSRYWLDSLAIKLRQPGRTPAPPAFTPSLPSPDPSAAATASIQAIADALTSELSSFVEELVKWSNELDPAEIRSHGEQIDLLWWLKTSDGPRDLADLVGWASTGLRLHTRVIPGPPGAPQLLRCRLGRHAEEAVALPEVAAAVSRSVPPPIADVCALLTPWLDELEGRTLDAVSAAEWLFDELSLVDLIGAES